jgi:hypothetical protein
LFSDALQYFVGVGVAASLYLYLYLELERLFLAVSQLLQLRTPIIVPCFMPSFFPATAKTCPGGPSEQQSFVTVSTQGKRKCRVRRERHATDEHLDLLAGLDRRDMGLDKLVAVWPDGPAQPCGGLSSVCTTRKIDGCAHSSALSSSRRSMSVSEMFA